MISRSTSKYIYSNITSKVFEKYQDWKQRRYSKKMAKWKQKKSSRW